MPGDIVNLNKARKGKARAEKEKQAAENRVRFGRTKAEREATRLREEQDRARLDALKLDRKPRTSPDPTDDEP